VGMG